MRSLRQWKRDVGAGILVHEPSSSGLPLRQGISECSSSTSSKGRRLRQRGNVRTGPRVTWHSSDLGTVRKSPVVNARVASRIVHSEDVDQMQS